MKYQLFNYKLSADQTAIGILVNGKGYNLATVSDNEYAPSIDALLENWEVSHARLRTLAVELAANPARYASSELDLEGLQWASLLERPGTIYGAGANYRDHVEAMGRAMNMKLSLDPRSEGIAPWHFIKAGRGSLAAHQQAIACPPNTQMLDWEAELAVFIGRRADKVSVEDALHYVAGYSCANDLSARDHLRRNQVDESSPFRFDWIGHKCFSGSCPLGPYLTPAEFIDSPENLDIKLWRNGKLEQDSNTSNHLYSIADQIAYLSQRIELFPGDVLLTGTPAGVGMETQTFIARGDVLKVWIEGLGELQNRII